MNINTYLCFSSGGDANEPVALSSTPDRNVVVTSSDTQAKLVINRYTHYVLVGFWIIGHIIHSHSQSNIIITCYAKKLCNLKITIRNCYAWCQSTA